MFELPAALLSWFYGITGGYTTAIALIAVVVMAITTPLTLKSTRGMLEMQKLAPEMRKLQNEYRSDRQKLNEEMMKLYQDHKVNPMASCLPIVAQMPVFIIMFRVLRGLTYSPRGTALPVSQSVWEDRKSTRLNSSHSGESRMPSSAWKKKKECIATVFDDDQKDQSPRVRATTR